MTCLREENDAVLQAKLKVMSALRTGPKAAIKLAIDSYREALKAQEAELNQTVEEAKAIFFEKKL